MECRTKAATERRARNQSPNTLDNTQVLEAIGKLGTQVAALARATTPPAPPPTTNNGHFARDVHDACEHLRQLTDYLAANPGDTATLRLANTTIDKLRKAALSQLTGEQAAQPEH